MSKIISNVLKIILPKIISPNQGDLVEKIPIMNNIMLIQESIHSSENQGENGMIIKIDMDNAFDRVRNSFLF
jgi:hypothetical protein